MNTDHVTVPLGRKPFQYSQFFTSHFEPFILSIFLLMGCIGTFYLFGHNLVQPNGVSVSPGGGSPLLSGMFAGTEEESASGDFDDYVKIPTRVNAGERFSFVFLQDIHKSRYVMEMGDGVRLIVTQYDLSYQYTLPGKYTVELKEIKDGLLHLVGTKTIKVK